MNAGPRPQPGDTPELHGVYIAQLRDHSLALVWLGYQRMQPAAFVSAQEDDITGELVRHMRCVIQDDTAPLWIEHYSVSEQVRSHAAGKLGKRRPIVDIEFERHKRGQRPCLRFEAKRLGCGAGISDYLGDEGLGAFLIGHYSRTHQEAGMLGYVQTDREDLWAARLSAELSTNPRHHRLTDDGAWRRLFITGAPPHSYQTKHFDERRQILLIVHILLQFSSDTGNRD